MNEHTSPGEKESCPEPRPGQNRLLCPPQASLSRTRPADTTGAGGTAEQCQPQSTHPDTCCYQGEGAQGAWPSRQTRATSMGRGRSALGAHRKLQGRLSSSSAQNATPEPNCASQQTRPPGAPTHSQSQRDAGKTKEACRRGGRGRARTTWERPRCGCHRTNGVHSRSELSAQQESLPTHVLGTRGPRYISRPCPPPAVTGATTLLPRVPCCPSARSLCRHSEAAALPSSAGIPTGQGLIIPLT